MKKTLYLLLRLIVAAIIAIPLESILIWFGGGIITSIFFPTFKTDFMQAIITALGTCFWNALIYVLISVISKRKIYFELFVIALVILIFSVPLLHHKSSGPILADLGWGLAIYYILAAIPIALFAIATFIADITRFKYEKTAIFGAWALATGIGGLIGWLIWPLIKM